jgi:hypothetical protein
MSFFLLLNDFDRCIYFNLQGSSEEQEVPILPTANISSDVNEALLDEMAAMRKELIAAMRKEMMEAMRKVSSQTADKIDQLLM